MHGLAALYGRGLPHLIDDMPVDEMSFIGQTAVEAFERRRPSSVTICWEGTPQFACSRIPTTSSLRVRKLGNLTPWRVGRHFFWMTLLIFKSFKFANY